MREKLMGIENWELRIRHSTFFILNSPSASPQAQVPTRYHASLAPDMSNTLVFVTRGGLWYHRATCRDARQPRIPMRLSHAGQYYRPCAVCRPLR